MKGMVLKNWETLALTQGHSTAFCKSLGVPGKEQLLRQEGEKFIFSKTDKYAANKIYTRTLAGTPGKTAFVKEAWRADGQDEESLTANIAFMVGALGPLSISLPSKSSTPSSSCGATRISTTNSARWRNAGISPPICPLMLPVSFCP